MKPAFIFLVSAAISYSAVLAGSLLWPIIRQAIRDKKYRNALLQEQQIELDKYRNLFTAHGYKSND